MSQENNIDPKSLFCTENDLQKIYTSVQNDLASFLVVDEVRQIIAETRLNYYRQVGIEVSFAEKYDTDAVAEMTIPHNLVGLSDLAASRSHFLLRPLMSVSEVFHARFNKELFLSIGPRSEGEILNMIGYGIPIEQIRALDLLSYSPWVDRGDMHEMPYADDTFSVVILGFVLGYSKNPKKLVKELSRVCKNNAIIAIGNEYNPKTNEELRQEAGYDVWEVMRYNSAQEIIDLFSDITDKVIFETEPPTQYRNSSGGMGVILRIKK